VFLLSAVLVCLGSLVVSAVGCEPCDTDERPPGREWIQDPVASEWDEISLLGLGCLGLAGLAALMAIIGRGRAAALFMASHVLLSLRLAWLLLAAGHEGTAFWALLAAVSGAVSVVAAGGVTPPPEARSGSAGTRSPGRTRP
jgi:hypothetical protein